MKTRALILLLAAIASGIHAEALIRPGDHIAIVGNTFADQMKKYGHFETLLAHRCNGVSVRNLGWGGDTVDRRDRPTNFEKEDTTLAGHTTDVILLCFGLGESFTGKAGLPGFESGLKNLVRHYRSQRFNGASPPRLALISPIAAEDHGATTPGHAARDARLAMYTQAMARVAESEKIFFVDLYTPTREHMNSAKAPRLTTNGIHPNEGGYRLTGTIMAKALAGPGQRMTVVIDAESLDIQAKAGGGELKRVGEALSIQLERSPKEVLLVIRNLSPGTYYLEAQGTTGATHEEWARGVVIPPPPEALERYRQAVIDKNTQFTYSWKALNTVHIVGERKKSNSGKALPAEVIEFNRIANERDADLQSKLAKTTRAEWRLKTAP